MPETAFKGSRLAKARSQVGVAARTKDPEALEAARRDFGAEKIADYIERVLDKFPPLTDAQIADVVGLLQSGR